MAEKEHWSNQHEKGKGWMRAITLFCIRILPGVVVRIFAVPVGFFFWLISGPERKAIVNYLKRVRPGRKPYTLPLFLAYSITIIEKVESWAGKIRFGKIHFQQDDITAIWKELEQGKGALLICFHWEIVDSCTVIIHIEHTLVIRGHGTVFDGSGVIPERTDTAAGTNGEFL